MIALTVPPARRNGTRVDSPLTLIRLRTRPLLTQEQVARALGLSSGQVVSQWERGKNVPTWRHQEALATLYGVALEEVQAAVRSTFGDRPSAYIRLLATTP